MDAIIRKFAGSTPVVILARLSDDNAPMSDGDVSKLMTVEAAMRTIDAVAVHPRMTRVDLTRCRGLYLAEDLLCDRDAPPFDKSVMDGYAVRAADIAGESAELNIAGTVAAGERAANALEAGCALAIMTGAPLPAGADAVAPVEMTERAGNDRVAIRGAVKRGQFIARQGCDAAKGSVVLKAGARMGPPQIAVAASIGAAQVPVFAPPTVAVLGTGDELVPVDATPTGAQIRSSNNSMLMALLEGLPCQATDLGLIGDDPQLIERRIREGLSRDVVMVSGGMSMGERDFVPAILRSLGGDLRIAKLRIKPGKPFAFAEMPDGKFVFGLPGNPVSAMVCALLLVSRLIRRMAGGPAVGSAGVAPISQAVEANGPRTFFQPAIWADGVLTLLKWNGSADIFTLARANALLVRPENQPAQPAGTEMEFVVLGCL